MTSPLSRRWLSCVFLVALVLCFAQSPGLISPDTKLDLTANRCVSSPARPICGTATCRSARPRTRPTATCSRTGAFFLLGDTLGLPGWVTQRLWWALLLTAGFWGRVAGGRSAGHRDPLVAHHRRTGVRPVPPRVLTTLGVDLV